MRRVERAGYSLVVEEHGPPEAPACILSHSLGSDRRMWRPQVEGLAEAYRLITYDHPGHGQSSRPERMGDIGDFGRDALAVADACGVGRFVFAGVSLGGMVGLWLAAHAGERVRHLVASNTAARIPDSSLLRARIALLRREPVEAIADNVIERWLTVGFRRKQPQVEALCRQMLNDCGAPAYADTAGMICNMDLRPELASIDRPCTILVGEYDRATPAAWGRDLAARISSAQCQTLASAHLGNIEAAGVFNRALIKALGHVAGHLLPPNPHTNGETVCRNQRETP
ncbi:MAG: alpha/beta fold hydrolase [Oceanipulchritudo sp.]